MLLDLEQVDDKMVLSFINSDKTRTIKEYPLGEIENWKTVSNTDIQKSTQFKNWDNKAVKKIKAKTLNKFSQIEFLWKLEEDFDTVFADNFPNVTFVDIEVEILDGFPEPTEALSKVTAISMLSMNSNAVTLFGCHELSKSDQIYIQESVNKHFLPLGKSFNVTYLKFDSETQLVSYFMQKVVPKLVVLSGWNFENFDWTYLITRSKKLGIDISKTSPVDRLSKGSIPNHVGIVDYAKIFDKWDKSIAVKENNTLDFVAKEVIGITKVKYNGNLQDLLEQNPKEYFYYSAVDTILVQLIDQKQKIFSLMFAIANFCNLPLYKTLSPVAITEYLLSKEYYQMNKVIAYDYKQQNSEAKFEGAYVKEPRPGFYNWVSCLDFASLYPSIMRMANISPESYLGIHKDEFSVKKFKNENHIITKTGAVYKKEQSSLKICLDGLYSKRRKYKDRYLDIQKELEELEKQLQEV